MPKLILVTGGSRGIGAAICSRLAADGYAVAVNYAADADAAQAVVQAITQAGGTAQAFAGDMADSQAVERLFAEATAALGPLVGLVNVAGLTGPPTPVEELDPATLTHLFAVNAIGPMLTSKEAVRRLSTQHGGAGGSIINFSSVAARLGAFPGMAAYAATKAAVESFTQSLASEVGPMGIRVNAIAPGMIETDMTRGPLSQAAFREQVVGMTPLRRIGQPAEVADVVAWLLSDEARFVTGHTLTVSGGI